MYVCQSKINQLIRFFDTNPASCTSLGAQTQAIGVMDPVSVYVSCPPCELTQNQIIARHVFKELPQFHGRVEEWPMFLSALNNATLSCGYSDGENLGRLQRSLKGQAMDMVRSRLLHADSVPGVVDTLNMIFGRPNVLIHQLLDKINKTNPPKADLGSLIKFAIAVQNLCGTIESSRKLEYLQNPLLIQTLTDKLPTTITQIAIICSFTVFLIVNQLWYLKLII